jgi:signal transduction histidine kinase
MNIVVNAIEALSDVAKGVLRQLNVSSRYDRQSDRVIVSFQDSGPGISEEEKGHVFEPFYSTKNSGTGIGLALCYDLVAEHGGSIDVESTKAGATFIIKLPCGAAEKNESDVKGQ